jgi:hypothetical protein
MAFAPFEIRTVGAFVEAGFKNLFEFDRLSDREDFPFRVWVTSPVKGIDSGWRYARVLKTVAYLVVDEDDNGDVVEKWSLSDVRFYG